jgi:methionyl-tRNA formyltransferase
MKLILFGTGPFAVPSFQSLVEDSSHEVVALVTRPIADAGKRRKTAETPPRDLGESEGLTVLDPVDANGDEKTGVTIIHMTPRLDGGPILVTAETAIGPTETAEEIEPRLAELGVQPVHDAIAMLKKWDGESVIGQPQDQALATKAPRLKKSQGQIDWTQSATQIINHIRAFQPWPGTFTHWHGPKQPLRLIVHAASMTTNSSGQIVEPGQVVACDAQLLVLQTGDGMLALDQVQPAGKKKMPIADFLRGRQPAIGDQFE